MRFMTAELFARARSEDDAAAEAAAEEWDRQGEEYRATLDALLPRLPEGARLLATEVCLHDAWVSLPILLNPEEWSLTITARLDHPKGKWLNLRYRLADPTLAVTEHTGPAATGEPWRHWLYDEFELVRDGSYPVFAHSVLFTGGKELRILFHSLSAQPFQPITVPEAAAATPGAEPAFAG